MIGADGFLPRQLAFRGSRLVYSNGILALAVIAGALIIVFQASVTRLIPLYAIGVFLSFTLVAIRHGASLVEDRATLLSGQEVTERGIDSAYQKDWRSRMVINGFGALCTAVVAVVFAATKFREGAWIVLILTPILVMIFFWHPPPLQERGPAPDAGRLQGSARRGARAIA